MCLKYEGDLNEEVNNLMDLEVKGEIQLTKLIKAGTTYYKMQRGYYDGNGVFFHQTSENRFSLSDKSKGVQYLAESPHTACHELYQEEKFIDRSDFERDCMAEINIERDLRVFDATMLATHLNIAVGDLMGPKTAYLVTQRLATALSKHADGLEYLSRYTGKPCVVLWSNHENGNGILSTLCVKLLKDYTYNGKTGKNILKSQCSIQVTG